MAVPLELPKVLVPESIPLHQLELFCIHAQCNIYARPARKLCSNESDATKPADCAYIGRCEMLHFTKSGPKVGIV